MTSVPQSLGRECAFYKKRIRAYFVKSVAYCEVLKRHHGPQHRRLVSQRHRRRRRLEFLRLHRAPGEGWIVLLPLRGHHLEIGPCGNIFNGRQWFRLSW